MKYLLDTNIISELGKPEPEKSVVDFVSLLPVAWLSTITLHELEYGIALIPEGRKKQNIDKAISGLVSFYGDYIISVGEPEAHQAALMRASRELDGRTLHLADSLIAGTAKVHNLAVVTRNVKDFVDLDIEVVNPFKD